MSFEIEFRNTHGHSASIGSAGPHTLVVDRPVDAGGQGLGFNGGELLYLAIGGCVSNDLFREASARGIRLTHVRVRVVGDFEGDPAVSQDVSYDVELAGEASRQQLAELVSHVDAIAEIPNSLRRGTPVTLRHVEIGPSRTDNSSAVSAVAPTSNHETRGAPASAVAPAATSPSGR